MKTRKPLIAIDPHPAYSDWDLRDIPKVRLDEFPRIYSEPVHPTPPTEPVLPETHDESKAGFMAATAVLVAVSITLGWIVLGLVIGTGL